jgi:DNA-binding transcriptional ArsR family regulator
MPIQEYIVGMSRAATTSDVFNAIAEPRRREIVGLLADGATRSVGELVDAMELAQPAVSKHLRVLRAVGVVSVRKVGKSRLYALNPSELKPVHDWVQQFERYWSHQLDRIKEQAERKAAARAKNN